MAKVVEPGRGPNYFPQEGMVRCKKCGCVLRYAPDDIRTEYDLFQKGELYSYVECPNDRCMKKLILHDRRPLRWFWQLVDWSVVKAEFIPTPEDLRR